MSIKSPKTSPTEMLSAFEDLRHRITSAKATMPKRLAQAARFLLDHPDDIALGTAVTVAEAASVQPSTLVRLAHHLGYGGFSDLQSVFRDRLLNRASSYGERLEAMERDFEKGHTTQSVLSGFLHAAGASLGNLAQSISEEKFDSAVQMLVPANIIYLIARRRAFPLAVQLSYTFSMLGIRSIVINSPNEIGNELAAMAGPHDAAIACSFHPYSSEIRQIVDQLIANKVPTLALTDSPLSPLASAATDWLEVADSDYSGFRTLAAAMTLSVALAVGVAEGRRHLTIQPQG